MSVVRKIDGNRAEAKIQQFSQQETNFSVVMQLCLQKVPSQCLITTIHQILSG